MKRVAFTNFGCKVNRAEIDSMIIRLAEYGAEYTEHLEDADILIVNTCAVTEKAQKNGEKYLSSVKKAHPHCLIVATGCTAELYKNQPGKLGADICIPNSDKEQTLEIIFKAKSETAAAPSTSTGTRAFLKIQDGCDAFCTYCIIPSLRGRPVSRNEAEILQEFHTLVEKGYKEIVLTGIHIGLYGIDTGTSLAELLNKLVPIEGDFRIRLTSLYVNEITPELIDCINKSNDKISQHFHISIQSCSADILRAMGRKYTPQDIYSAVSRIREVLKDAYIGADIITGFPGETETLYQETLTFLKEIKLDYLHVFPYSIRPNTPAAKLEQQIPAEVKQKRAKELHNLAAQQKHDSAVRMLGKTVRVLTEKGNKGHSGSFHLVYLPDNTTHNIFADAVIREVKPDGSLVGDIIL